MRLFDIDHGTRLVALFLLFGAVVHATTVTLTITSGQGQFPGKQSAAFGPTTTGTLTLNLTPNVPANFPVNQFTGFQGLDNFPPTVGANTTFQQTITVNGVPLTVTRTVTVQNNSPAGCSGGDPALSGNFVQQIAPGPAPTPASVQPSVFTFDLGALGKVDVNLTMGATAAINCTNAQPNNALIIVPGTTQPTILLHDVPGVPSGVPIPPSLLLTLAGVAGAGLYQTRRRWLARFNPTRTPR